MPQVLPTASIAPQVVVLENGAPALMLATFSVAVPLLVSVTAAELLPPRTTLPKLSALGFITAPGCVPVPLRATVDGLVGASLAILSVPLAAPVAVGVNVTVIEQEALAASVAPQLVVLENGALVVMPLIFSVALPLLVSVTAALLLLPRTTLPRLSELLLSEAAG
jgi:hypothetical protein